MITAFSRIIKYGFQGFWRNGWLSMVTISILVIALFVFEGLIMFRIVTELALNTLKEKADIVVFFKAESPEDKILEAQKALESMSEVKSVDYISKDKALETFKARHQEDEAITQSLEEIQDNPLLASLNIKAYDLKKYAMISDYIKNSGFSNLIYKLDDKQTDLVISKLSKIIDTAETGSVVLIIFLASIGVLVTFNTIRLAIYSSREEIGIMRLVGASNWFIRGPYMVEGVIYGIIGAIMSLVLFAPAIYFISPYMKAFIEEMNLWQYFTSNFMKLFGYQVLFGVALGVVSSIIAVRRYLRI